MTEGLIRTFLAVAEHGQISGAAKSLFVSPAAISKQIGMFENEVGVVCFERSPKGMSLTRGGQILFDYFKRREEEYGFALYRAKMANKDLE